MPTPPPAPPAPQGPSCDCRHITVDHDVWYSGEPQPGDFLIRDSVVSKASPYCIPKEGEETVTIKYFCAILPTGDYVSLPIRPVPQGTGYQVNGGHSWKWDGNVEKPTLTPSVNLIGRWHGWVTSGRMISC